MPAWLYVVAVGLIVLLVPLVAFGRMAWRILHDNEQMDAGGSLGDQAFGTKNTARSTSERAKGPKK